jgi:hypothetical protein
MSAGTVFSMAATRARRRARQSFTGEAGVTGDGCQVTDGTGGLRIAELGIAELRRRGVGGMPAVGAVMVLIFGMVFLRPFMVVFSFGFVFSVMVGSDFHWRPWRSDLFQAADPMRTT